MTETKRDRGGFTWRQWLLVGVNLVLILLALLAFWGWRTMAGTLGDAMTAAERFRGQSDLRFAQEAVFLPIDGGRTADDVWQFRSTLETKFVEESLVAPENGSLYLDGYSGSGQVSLQVGDRSASVEAIGVGGEFFYFHPLPLKSGTYLAEGDLMDDRILLDEMLAWRLFGSSDIAGMDILVNGRPFVVAGVVEREEDFASQKALGEEKNSVFLPFSALKKIDEGLTIHCYEIVVPDPISGYGRKLVESFSTDPDQIVEMTGRYDASRLLRLCTTFGERSMRRDGVLYPYWENAARLTEDYAALFLVLLVLFSICPGVTALVLVIRLGIRTARRVKTAVPQGVDTMVERHREARFQKTSDKGE